MERERDDWADKDILDRIIPSRLEATARIRHSVVEGKLERGAARVALVHLLTLTPRTIS